MSAGYTDEEFWGTYRLPALAGISPRPRGDHGFPRCISSVAQAASATVKLVASATMPFYQLVCIAAHYPEYVCFALYLWRILN